MTGIETKRARGKCIANALACQLCWTFLFDLSALLGDPLLWLSLPLCLCVTLVSTKKNRKLLLIFPPAIELCDVWRDDTSLGCVPNVGLRFLIWPGIPPKFFRKLEVSVKWFTRWLHIQRGGLWLRRRTSVRRSRVRLPAVALPGSLGQLSLPSLLGR